MKQKNHSLNSGIKGRKAYNNGINVIYLSEEDFIPEGFVKGGLSNRTPEQMKLGYDKLFSINYGKNVSNKELMLKNNFVEIYDAGQALYVWLNNKFTRGENT